MAKTTTPAFDAVNDKPDKEPVLVLQIDGVDMLFGSAQIFTTIRYDDPGVFYDGTYVYDGLRPLGSGEAQSLIDRKGSNASFGQKVEQWDGRSSVETLSLKLIDLNGYFTELCTPGLVLDDIMNRKVKVFYGYSEISFPEDYLLIFRGYINQVQLLPGAVMFTFTDPNSKRKQDLFNGATTTLAKAVYSTKEVTIDITTDEIGLSSHGFAPNDQIKLSAINGVLPPPLDPSTTYYVVNPTADAFQISLSPSGFPIDITNYPTPPPFTPTYFVSNASQSTLVLESTTGIYKTVLDALGNNDDTVTVGLVLNKSEIVTYTNAGIQIDNQTITGVVRGAYGTPTDSYDIGTSVECFIAFNDNPFSIALKAMLSGFGGPFSTAQPLRAIVGDDAGHLVPDSITLPQGVDAIVDYGLSTGDAITLSGSAFPGNNATFLVADFTNENRTIIVQEKGILVQETPVGSGNLTTVAAFRSKYDTYPITAGLGITPEDVFVTNWENIRDTFVPFTFTILQYSTQASAKDWLEKHLLRPLGAYSLTQNAQISVGMTHPPLASDLTQFLTPDNVTGAGGIVVDRGLNNRFFYNSIVFTYNYDPINDAYGYSYTVVDADAIERMGQVSELDIEVRGLYQTDTIQDTLNRIANRILQRYHYAAETIDLDVLFSVGCQIDSGDIVILTDTTPPILQISNTLTGERGIYDRIMEVQERKVGISNGKANLSLLSNNGFAFTDRYGVVAPASRLDPTFTQSASLIRITDSFLNPIPGTEYKKWLPYSGSQIKVFKPDFSQVGVTFYTVNTADPYKLELSPPLGFTPDDTYIITFADYSSTPSTNSLVKATFCHWDSAAPIIAGSSSSVFTLASGYGMRYLSGAIIYVMSPDGTRFSPDVKILTIVGDTVTIGPIFPTGINPNLGFTPQAGDIMQLGGFPDGGNSYRLI